MGLTDDCIARLRCRGISGTEVIIIMAVIVVSAIALTIVFNRTSESRQASRCQFNLHALADGVEAWLQDHDEEFPLPEDQPIQLTSGPVALTNATADLHLLLLSNGYYRKDATVCPGDENPVVRMLEAEIEMIGGGDLRADIDAAPSRSWSNVSYANRDPARVESRSAVGQPVVWFGDRGPRLGRPDATSLSYRLHGRADQWVGHFAISDGRVIEYVEPSTEQSTPFAPSGFVRTNSALSDNLFAPDTAEAPFDDQFLAIFRTREKENQLEAVWD